MKPDSRRGSRAAFPWKKPTGDKARCILADLALSLVSAGEPRELVSPLRESLGTLLPAASAWLAVPASKRGRWMAWGLCGADPVEEWEGPSPIPPGAGASANQAARAPAFFRPGRGCTRIPLSWRDLDGPFLYLRPARGHCAEELEGDVLPVLVPLLKLFFQKIEQSAVLQRAKEQWEKAFDVSGDLFFFHDDEGAILRANMPVSTFAGLPIRECIGARCSELFPGLCEGSEAFEREWAHPESDRVFQASTQVIALERGLATFHVLHEVTQQKKLEALGLVQQQIDLTRKLLEGIAHEIRNPIFSISTLAQALRKASPQTPEAEVLLQTISEEVRRVDALVRHFLQLAYPAGRRPRTQLALSELIEKALALAAERWPELDLVRIETRPPAGPMTLWGDAESLAWALSDLIENALHFGGPGTSVELGISEAQGRAVISIRDMGPGIAAGERDRIFEPFFTTRPRHAGLGLTLARTTVVLHGGTLAVAESAPSPGTTFLIALPLGMGPQGG